MDNEDIEVIATDSEVHFISADSTEFYEYIVIADDGLDTINVANIPSYIPYYICIIVALGVISGLIFGYISSWKL